MAGRTGVSARPLRDTKGMSETIVLAHSIAGRAIRSSQTFETRNPSDVSDVVAVAPIGGEAEVGAAVHAARRAQPEWGAASPEVRADCLDRIGTALLDQCREIGALLSREEGKTLAEGVAETARAGRIFRYFAGEAIRRHGLALDSVRPGVDVRTARQAVGVFGLITPWNFPIAIPAWKIAPALAFGNAVVVKPASQTPATAARLGELIVAAGVPAGVFNLVFGSGAVGDALVAHPEVDGVSFTGSQAIGARVGRACMTRQAQVQLEMGGKNPLVVLDDADLDRAVAIAIDGGFYSSGQRCTASSRIIVTEGIHDRFVAAVAARAAAIRVGHALDPASEVGPLSSEAQLKTALDYIDLACGEGGELVAGGQPLERATRGWYIQPALIAGTASGARINAEEVFGPVVSVVRAKDYDEALAIANAGEFGLSAGIVTTSLKHARHFEKHALAGMVMVNLPTAGVDYHVPFGGIRKSSYGAREQGFAAVEFYTRMKTVYVAD